MYPTTYTFHEILNLCRNLEILSAATLDAHSEVTEDGFQSAIEGVKEAMKMTPKARLDLVVAILSENEEDEEEEEEDQENIEPMEVVPLGQKRPRSIADSDDSDGEIGVRKVHSISKSM